MKEVNLMMMMVMCFELHFNICKEKGVKLNAEHWCDHVPKSFETNYEYKVAILWNQKLQTDRTLVSNKSDIINCDNKKGTCMLIGVRVPEDRNVIKKEAEKILKYKDLIIEIRRMWNVKVKVKVKPVITGATGTISKSLRQYLNTKLRKCKKQPYWALHT
jgi:hypothetical protein